MSEILRDDFPFFLNNPALVYLDNAATTQKVQCVIDAMVDHMTKDNSNIGRSLYPLSSDAEKKVEDARLTAARFINASKEEIIFTKGSTEALNVISSSVCAENADKGKNVVISVLEHSSNYAPWLRDCRKFNLEFRVAENEEDVIDLIDENTAIVSVTGMSNVTGFMPDIGRICGYAKQKGALSCIDASQLAAHRSIDVKDIGCDYLCFSSHKLYGPEGVGVLYSKQQDMSHLVPLCLGGGAVDSSYCTKEGHPGFEAGTQNIAAIIGFERALKYLIRNYNHIKDTENELSRYLYRKMSELKGFSLVSSEPSLICSFTSSFLSSHDLGVLLGNKGICVRTGSCCAHSLVRKISEGGICRVSLSFYNTKDDIDALISQLEEAQKRYGGSL